MLLIAVALFIIGSIGDNLLTYKYVVVEGVYGEANPFTASRIFSQPLWMWFVYDFAGLVAVVALALGYRVLMLWLSRRDPLWRRERIRRIASKYWVIVMVVAGIRLLPVVHNLLILAFGVESPLPVVNRFFWELLNNR